MPYDVLGWVEGRWSHDNDTGVDQWYALLNLSPFFLFGDAISDEMFGLAKVPSDQPHFPGRGIPLDASSTVVDECQRNKCLFEKKGDGDFGHTYALYSELRPLLFNVPRLSVESACHEKGRPSSAEPSNWAPVFAILETLVRHGFEADSLRLVVWASW